MKVVSFFGDKHWNFCDELIAFLSYSYGTAYNDTCIFQDVCIVTLGHARMNKQQEVDLLQFH